MTGENSLALIHKDPRFKILIRRKWLLSFGLAVSMISIYVLFVLVMIFMPDWLLTAVSAGNPFNIGLLLTLLMLLFIMGSMICYLFFKENDTHTDIHKLIAEHEVREAAGNH
jgi:uncharacterized membrane protein (DUF485 family)